MKKMFKTNAFSVFKKCFKKVDVDNFAPAMWASRSPALSMPSLSTSKKLKARRTASGQAYRMRLSQLPTQRFRKQTLEKSCQSFNKSKRLWKEIKYLNKSKVKCSNNKLKKTY